MPTLWDRLNGALGTIGAIWSPQPSRAPGRPYRPPARRREHVGEALSRWATRTVEKIRTHAFAGNLRFLPWLDHYTDETHEIRAEYLHMLRDPAIKAGFLTKVLSVCQLPLQVHPQDPDDPRHQACAEFVKFCYKKIGVTDETGEPRPASAWSGPVGCAWSILSGGILRGHSVSELLFEEKPMTYGRFRGKRRWKALKSKDTQYLQLSIDQYRNITAIRGTAYNAGKVFKPEDFVIYTYLPLYESPVGMSDFRAAYAAYWHKDAFRKLWGLHLDKYSGPWLQGTYGTPAQKAALEQAFENARGGGWITVPTGALVEATSLAVSGSTDFEAAIRYCDQQILIALVGAHLQVLEGQVSGARGDTEVHKETSQLFQWLLAETLANVYQTQMVPELVRHNYHDVEPPDITLGSVSEAEMEARARIDKALQDLGLKLSKKETYNFFSRSEPTDPDDILEPPGAGPGGGPDGPGGGAGGLAGLLGGGPNGAGGREPESEEEEEPEAEPFAEGQPCKRGEAASKTGCKPASGKGGKKESGTGEDKISEPWRMSSEEFQAHALGPEESSKLVARLRAGDPQSKNRGEHREEKIAPVVVTEIPTAVFDKEFQEHLRASTDPARVAAYVQQNIQAPIYALPSRRSGKWFVSDGGHRLLAAIIRGDEHINAIVPATSHKQLIQASLAAGEAVPPEILADYPDLAEKYGKFAEGQPCKRGEAAAKTGCVPASGEGGKKIPSAAKEPRVPPGNAKEWVEERLFAAEPHLAALLPDKAKQWLAQQRVSFDPTIKGHSGQAVGVTRHGPEGALVRWPEGNTAVAAHELGHAITWDALNPETGQWEDSPVKEVAEAATNEFLREVPEELKGLRIDRGEDVETLADLIGAYFDPAQHLRLRHAAPETYELLKSVLGESPFDVPVSPALAGYVKTTAEKGYLHKRRDVESLGISPEQNEQLQDILWPDVPITDPADFKKRVRKADAILKKVAKHSEPEEEPEPEPFAEHDWAAMSESDWESFAASDWQPYRLTRGPNKGKQVWKHRTSGKISHDNPKVKEKEAKAKEAAKAKAAKEKEKAAADAAKAKEKEAAKAGEKKTKALSHLREIAAGRQKPTPARVRDIGAVLVTLKADELKALKAELGVKGGSTKAQMVERIQAKALAKPEGKAAKPVAKPVDKATAKSTAQPEAKPAARAKELHQMTQEEFIAARGITGPTRYYVAAQQQKEAIEQALDRKQDVPDAVLEDYPEYRQEAEKVRKWRAGMVEFQRAESREATAADWLDNSPAVQRAEAHLEKTSGRFNALSNQLLEHEDAANSPPAREQNKMIVDYLYAQGESVPEEVLESMGFTGTDPLGREWRDGKLVSKAEEAKKPRQAKAVPSAADARQPAVLARINTSDPVALSDAIRTAAASLPDWLKRQAATETWEAHKVPLAAIYDHLQDRLGDMTLDQFKQQLLTLNQQGHIGLTNLNVAGDVGGDVHELAQRSIVKHPAVGTELNAVEILGDERQRRLAGTKKQQSLEDVLAVSGQGKPGQPADPERVEAHQQRLRAVQTPNESQVHAAITAGLANTADPVYQPPTIKDLYDRAKQGTPSLTPEQFNATLLRMQDAGQIELQPHTRALGALESEAAHLIPGHGETLRYVRQPQPPEPGFTGTDSLGREWRNGKLVSKVEEPTTAKPARVKPEPKQMPTGPAGNAVQELAGRVQGEGRTLLQRALGNAGDGPTPERLSQTLVHALGEAKTPDVQRVVKEALEAVGAQQIGGQVGVSSTFDGRTQEGPEGLFPGDPVRTVREGWESPGGVLLRKAQVEAAIPQAGPPSPPEPGFTGTDSLGREWRNGKLVSKAEEPGAKPAVQPASPGASAPERHETFRSSSGEPVPVPVYDEAKVPANFALPNEPALRASVQEITAELRFRWGSSLPVPLLYDKLRERHPDLSLGDFHRQLIAWQKQDQAVLQAANDPDVFSPDELAKTLAAGTRQGGAVVHGYVLWR